MDMLERKTYGSEQYEIRFCIGDFLYGHSRDVVRKDIIKSVYPCTVNIADYALMAYLNQHGTSCLTVYRAKAVVDQNRDTAANPQCCYAVVPNYGRGKCPSGSDGIRLLQCHLQHREHLPSEGVPGYLSQGRHPEKE